MAKKEHPLSQRYTEVTKWKNQYIQEGTDSGKFGENSNLHAFGIQLGTEGDLQVTIGYKVKPSPEEAKTLDRTVVIKDEKTGGPSDTGIKIVYRHSPWEIIQETGKKQTIRLD